MTIVKNVTVDGVNCPVTISDDDGALQAAYAAGGAVIGIWSENGTGSGFASCLYLVTAPEDVDGLLLERAARRRLLLPWHIKTTERLLIREFKKEDPLETPEECFGAGTMIFALQELRDAYIVGSYRFHECGLWALEERLTGRIIGKAGITGNELGYHIYPAFRRMGYAFEACVGILAYASEIMHLHRVTIKTEEDNTASRALASRLGFVCRGKEGRVLVYERDL